MDYGLLDVSSFVLIILWLLYFAIHSLLASLAFKKWFQEHFQSVMPWYRVIFNSVSVLLLVPPLLYMQANRGRMLWEWQGTWFYLANLLAILAILGFLWTMRSYDGDEFLGIRQVREQRSSIADDETFKLSPMHRYVRHPWYALSLVLIWTRDMDTGLFITALMISLYFIIGLRLEERKLVAYHGERYRRYRQQVPALVPLPWKILTKKASRKLEKMEKSE